MREAVTRYFLGSSAGRRSSPQVQDCVRRLPQRPRTGVDSRSRVVRAHRRRQARLPPHHRRRHLHFRLGLPALRLPARRADARSGGSDRSRLSPVRRLQASPAQPDEVPHQGLGWEGWRQKYERRSRRFAKKEACRSNASATGCVVEQAPTWAQPPAPSIDEVKRAAASVEVHGPGIMPGSVRLQTYSDSCPDVAAHHVGLQRQAGFVRDGASTLGDMTAGSEMHVLADLAEAYADGAARLTIGQNVLFRWVKVGSLQGSISGSGAASGPRARTPSPTS